MQLFCNGVCVRPEPLVQESKKRQRFPSHFWRAIVGGSSHGEYCARQCPFAFIGTSVVRIFCELKPVNEGVPGRRQLLDCCRDFFGTALDQYRRRNSAWV